MTGRKHTSKFKLKVVLEVLSERFTIHELGRKYEIHPVQITKWKTQFLKNGEGVFDTKAKDAKGSSENRLTKHFNKYYLILQESIILLP